MASPALAAPVDGDSHYVFVLGNNNHVQVAEDDVFNAGRDNTVGSNDGTAPLGRRHRRRPYLRHAG